MSPFGGGWGRTGELAEFTLSQNHPNAIQTTLKTEPARTYFVQKNKIPATAQMQLSNQHRNKICLLLAITAIGIAAIFFVEPIPQDHAYHNFADTRTILHIPNCCNVLSNLPFIIIGLAGMVAISSKKLPGMFPELKPAYLIFFAGIFFTGFGSAYYHLEPNNATLLWDRLPMTIAFMAFFAIIIGEFTSLKMARKLLLPLLLIGAASVLYWHFTESAGHGDLRFYALVQFLPIILIPLIMLLFKAKTNTNLYTWLVIAAYLIAKLFETYDDQIFEFTKQISGHTLKHFAAALAPLLFLIGLFKRKITEGSEA